VDKAGADEVEADVAETETLTLVLYAGAGHDAGAAKADETNRAHVAFARRVRPRILMVRNEIGPLGDVLQR
jgi:hypothetical protein